MNVLILWVFALGLICPSTTVLADEVPALVRKVRQQNTLPPDMKSAVKGAPTTDPVIEEDGEFDDAKTGQQITEPTGIKKTTHQQATSTTPAVRSQDQQQDVKGGKNPRKDTSESPGDSSAKKPVTIGQTKTTTAQSDSPNATTNATAANTPSAPSPIVVNVNVVVQSEPSHGATSCTAPDYNCHLKVLPATQPPRPPSRPNPLYVPRRSSFRRYDSAPIMTTTDAGHEHEHIHVESNGIDYPNSPLGIPRNLRKTSCMFC
ncbi:uncharacterized protein LOC121597679 [Anopheles merus]|uniref:uncharacterized protein LOC121597679 n=1 Tax=Anopheles merus TaxID=30066 RepID=UPI001BE49C06|nr:uncharacterized protein LOC121597679 [Anopheles merus]